MVKTLEELKEMAEQSLNLQLEVMKNLTSLKFEDTIYFIQWFTNHPIGREITLVSKNLAMLKYKDTSTTIQE